MRTICCLAVCTPPARMRVFTGVQYPCGLNRPRVLTCAEARVKALACLVFPGEADDLRAAAERGDVVRGVARAAGQNLRRVVLKNEHRRLARHARHAAVDELVGDQIADDRDAARGNASSRPMSRA